MEEDLEKASPTWGAAVLTSTVATRPNPESTSRTRSRIPKRYGAGSPKLIRGHWEVIAIAVLMALGASLTKLERTIPALRPAPGWMGPLFLALPFTAVAIYFVVRFVKSRR